jgi:hypothetical protein
LQDSSKVQQGYKKASMSSMMSVTARLSVLCFLFGFSHERTSLFTFILVGVTGNSSILHPQFILMQDPPSATHYDHHHHHTTATSMADDEEDHDGARWQQGN